MNVRLFIEGNLVEINESISLAVTQTFENVQSPTDYISDYTKTITIPRTKSNDKLFGSLFRMDRVLVSGGVSGIYFDPTKKLSFKFELNGDILMQGYARMLDVTANGYECTLYGELGDVFNELKKLTFGTSEDGEEYEIDSPISRQQMSATNMVYFLTHKQMHISYGDAYDEDVIGFAMENNGLWDGFDSTQAFDASGNMTQFSKVLETAFSSTGGSEVVGNGLNWREYGEYRCEFLRPFVYCNKLWQILADKCRTLTGWTLDLTGDFFNYNNPYWRDMVYTLPLVTKPVQDISTESVDVQAFTSSFYLDSSHYSAGSQPFPLYKDGSLWYGSFINNNEPYDIAVDMKCNWGWSSMPNTNALIVDFGIRNRANNNVLKTKRYYLAKSTCTLNLNDGEVIYIDDWEDEKIYETFTLRIVNSEEVDNKEFYAYISMRPYNTLAFRNQNASVEFFTMPQTIVVQSSTTLSSPFFHFDFKDMLPSDFNLLTWCVDYAKMFGLCFDVDKTLQTIHVRTRNEFFANADTLDWSNKIDKSSSWKIKPLSFDKRYQIFNYEDNEATLLEEYDKNRTATYGAKRIDTGYQFNSEENDVVNVGMPPLVASCSYRDWTKMIASGDFGWYLSRDIFPTSYKGSGNKLEVGNGEGKFLFVNGCDWFDTSLRSRSGSTEVDVTMTSQTEVEKDKKCYHYYRPTSAFRLTRYPMLDVVSALGEVVSTYEVPSVDYANHTWRGIEISDAVGIYENFWEKWINERYNANTKLVEATFFLLPNDLHTLKTNAFIKVGNSLFHLNKISDADLVKGGKIKCELVQVNNKSNYTGGVTILQEVNTNSNVQRRYTRAVDTTNTSTLKVYAWKSGSVTCTNPLTHALTGWSFYLDGESVSLNTLITLSEGEHTIGCKCNDASASNAWVVLQIDDEKGNTQTNSVEFINNVND